MAERKASATWQGNLFEGSGTVSAVSSGLFNDAEVSWPARTEAPDGKTSPEELMAGAHAACFCMALSNELSTRGHVPARIHVGATANFEGGNITTMILDVDAEVPGIDEAGFQEALGAAEQSCPVSKALVGNVDINVTGGLS